MERWKNRSRELLKAIFCHQKKTIRKQTDSEWNFLQPPIQVCRDAYIPYFKILRRHFLRLHVFRRMSQSSGQMLNEHVVNYNPSPSEFTSRIEPLIFLWIPKGFISPEYFFIFFSNLYIPARLKKKKNV